MRMVNLTENLTACEFRFVIHFQNVKKTKSVDVYQQICELYRENLMNERFNGNEMGLKVQ